MDYFIMISVFIFGTIIGSFLNMLIYRLPLEIPLLKVSRSICPNCKQDIKFYENIPLISFFILKGKCSQCKENISWSYPFVELGSGLLFLFLYIKFNFSSEFIAYAGLFSTLFVLSLIDLKYKSVPDYLLLIAFLIALFLPSFDIHNSLLFAGAFILLDFFVTFYIQNIKSRITKNENFKTQKALGDGDIPIVAIIGGVSGLEFGLLAIVIASLIAIIPAIYMTKHKEIEVPFIPFLSLGFVLMVLFGEEIYSICYFGKAII